MTPIDPEVLKVGERFLSGVCGSVDFYPELCLRFSSGGALFVGSYWRAQKGREVLATSEETQERLTEFVVGASVKSLASTGRYNDLVVAFDNETLLETYDKSTNYERWRIAGQGPMELIVGGPGDLWSSFGFDPKDQL